VKEVFFGGMYSQKRWRDGVQPPVDQATHYKIVSFGKEIEGLLDELLKGVKP